MKDGNHGQQLEPQMNADRRGYERQGRWRQGSGARDRLRQQTFGLCVLCALCGIVGRYAVLQNEPPTAGVSSQRSAVSYDETAIRGIRVIRGPLCLCGVLRNEPPTAGVSSQRSAVSKRPRTRLSLCALCSLWHRGPWCCAAKRTRRTASRSQLLQRLEG